MSRNGGAVYFGAFGAGVMVLLLAHGLNTVETGAMLMGAAAFAYALDLAVNHAPRPWGE